MSEPQALRNARLYFASTVISTLSYGVYMVMVILSIKLLLRRKHNHRVNITYSLFMLAVATTWFILTTRTNEIEIVEESYDQPYRFSLYCSEFNIGAVALSSVIFIGSDILLLYRLYILFERNIFICLLPILTWMAFIGIAIAGNLSCTSITPPTERMTTIVVVYYALPFIPNLLCTLFIVGKLLWHQKILKVHGVRSGASNYSLLTVCLAESGAVYSATGIVNFVLVFKQNDLQSISGAIFGASALLCEAHIILRIALGIELKPLNDTTKDPTLPIVFGHTSTETGSSGLSSGEAQPYSHTAAARMPVVIESSQIL